MTPARVAGSAVPEAIWAVEEACTRADGVSPLDEAARLELAHHGLAQARLWLAGTAGFALCRGESLDLAVSPDHRRQGVGGALLAAVLADTPGPLVAWSHTGHPGAARLAARTGFAPVRELWVLRRPTAAPLTELTPPSGVAIRCYREADAANLLAVNAAAFAAHPEQGSLDAADLAERMAEPWFDPAGLLLAEDLTTGDLLGFHWTKQHSSDLGEVYVVGIAPTAQGRGLGRLLTLAGLHHLAGLGVSEVLLYVEADNAAALATYTGLGFTHAPTDTHIQYRRSP